MIEFILEYLERNNVYVLNDEEQHIIEEGIRLYLLENGISDKDTGEYYEQYILRHLLTVNSKDLKHYFENYPSISGVNQIIIEYIYDGTIAEEKVTELRKMMSALYESGLNDRYVPANEVKQILG